MSNRISNRCIGTTKKGLQCSKPPVEGSKWCRLHRKPEKKPPTEADVGKLASALEEFDKKTGIVEERDKQVDQEGEYLIDPGWVCPTRQSVLQRLDQIASGQKTFKKPLGGVGGYDYFEADAGTQLRANLELLNYAPGGGPEKPDDNQIGKNMARQMGIQEDESKENG